jgi:hypothetical protein
MTLWILKRFYRRLLRGAAYEIVVGRLKERGAPQKGRWLRHEIDAIFAQTWDNAETILPEADLASLPNWGNRHNVFLAVLTIAAYDAFRDAGAEKDDAIELFADMGWKLYTRFLTLPRFFARLRYRDPQRQMNFILRALLRFPFSAPGRPGYEVRAWAEPGRFCTYWTHCPPYAFVKEYTRTHGDSGEVEAFIKSWCWYDWALAYAMVDGSYDSHGYYERPHTLSAGDAVCDMCWYVGAVDRGV